MLTSLRAILRNAARTLGVERAANAALIAQMWAEVVGPPAAAHSRILGVRGTVVLAEAEAGPWAQDLSARRGGYIAEINRRLGSAVVTEIRFRQATGSIPGTGLAATDAQRQAEGSAAGERTADESTLSREELAAVDRAVEEIGDPDIRDGARRAMVSQLKWRKRQEAGNERP